MSDLHMVLEHDVPDDGAPGSARRALPGGRAAALVAEPRRGCGGCRERGHPPWEQLPCRRAPHHSSDRIRAATEATEPALNFARIVRRRAVRPVTRVSARWWRTTSRVTTPGRVSRRSPPVDAGLWLPDSWTIQCFAAKRLRLFMRAARLSIRQDALVHAGTRPSASPPMTTRRQEVRTSASAHRCQRGYLQRSFISGEFAWWPRRPARHGFTERLRLSAVRSATRR